MKLQILQENLKRALSYTSRITSPKAQLPVLGNVYLSSKGPKLTVASTNLELSISSSMAVKTEEDGEITIPAKTLTEIVNNLPNESLNLETDKETLKITSGNFKSTLAGMNAADFPVVTHTIDTKKSLSLKGDGFSESLSQVTFSVSLDESRPILTGVLCIFKDNQLTLVSTDGFRLSKKQMAVESSDSFSFILPRSALGELARLSGQGENIQLMFNKEESQVVFSMGEAVLSSRILEGEFPDFEKIIPKVNTITVSADKEDILRAVKLASVFARESANIVKLKVRENLMELIAESQSSGSQSTQVEIKLDTKEQISEETGFEIAFNYKFIEDYLAVVKGEEVQMEFSNSNAPGVFRDPSSDNYLHLIMPVRLQV